MGESTSDRLARLEAKLRQIDRYTGSWDLDVGDVLRELKETKYDLSILKSQVEYQAEELGELRRQVRRLEKAKGVALSVPTRDHASAPLERARRMWHRISARRD